MSEKINVMVTTENMEQMQMADMIASVGAVSGNDVRVRVTNISDDSLVFKFQRVAINV